MDEIRSICFAQPLETLLSFYFYFCDNRIKNIMSKNVDGTVVALNTNSIYYVGLPILGHEYYMGSAYLINLSLLIQLFFQKHYELFPNRRKFSTTCHITI